MFDILQPNHLKQLEQLQLRSQRRFLGSRHGGNTSLKRGHGIEFADYRRYEMGDDPRHIDWAVFGRSERLYVKQFQEEQEITVYCLIDNTPSMHHPAEDQKWHYANEIALGMLYVALAQHDRVQLTIPGYSALGPGSGGDFIHRLGEFCKNAKPVTPETYQRGFQRFLHEISFPGICIYISDFLMPTHEIQKCFEALYVNNLDVICIQIVGALERSPERIGSEAILIDSETGVELPILWTSELQREYDHRHQTHQAEIRKLASKYQFRYFVSQTDSPPIRFFIETLAGSGVFSA